MQLLNSFFNITDRQDRAFDICLNPEHFIFKAHFPGNPIVPGVCQVQIVGELLREIIGRDIYLGEVKNIKYLALMTPAERTDFSVAFQKIDETENGVKTTVNIAAEGKTFTKLSLTYSYSAI